ncbi:MAG: thioredoxin family protein [Caldilineaceae bacterium]
MEITQIHQRSKIGFRTLWICALVLLALSLAACGGDDEAEAAADGPTRFLYFYSADCPFCDEMEPVIDSVETDYGDKIQVERYDAAGEDGAKLMADFELTETPSYVIIGPDGVKVWSLTGQIHRDMLRQQVQLRLPKE